MANPDWVDIKIALRAWADKYSSRIDQDLTNAWSNMKDRLKKLIEELSVNELAFGPGKEFEERVKNAIQAWVVMFVQPILDDAQAEYQAIITSDAFKNSVLQTPMAQDSRGNLQFLDLIGPAALVGGVLATGGAVMLGIAAATKWLIIPIIIFNWPLLIGGLLVGAILIGLGVTNLATIKSRLYLRFENLLMPQIKEALIGEGYEHDKKKIPSVRRQLQDAIEKAASAAHDALAKEK